MLYFANPFFSEKHLENNKFEKNFKVSVEKELHEILNEKEFDDIYDSTLTKT